MRYLLTLLLFAYSSVAFSNAITVSNLSTDIPSSQVTFDLEWQNSWRVDSTGIPYNWDAAWVFVKFAECDSTTAATSVEWEHGKLNTTIASHNFADLEPVISDGTVGISDSLGVMLRRSTNGYFSNIGPSTITLTVANFDPSKTYHVRVVAIEMVYVTEGPFSTGGYNSYNAFDSIYIDNENARTITSLATGANTSIDLSAQFPKGYDPFHCMKYEISAGQYVTFLNTINSVQGNARYLNSYNQYRNRVYNNGTGQFDKYTATGKSDRATNYMGWNDLLSYLDWSGLRPMTELQYEKACRGFGDVVINEFAWGTGTYQNGLQFTGAENGTEFFVNGLANCTYNNVIFSGGDGGRGPARCGIFALPTNNTRQQSGASYYGIMELSGNVYEQCVNVSSRTDINVGVVNYTGNLGDGYLDAAGLYDVPGWPTANFGSGVRGGSFASAINHLRLGARYYFQTNGNRSYDVGGRGIR